MDKVPYILNLYNSIFHSLCVEFYPYSICFSVWINPTEIYISCVIVSYRLDKVIQFIRSEERKNMKQSINTGFVLAQERYASVGVDVEKALILLKQAALSIHCWQGDDVQGFESAVESLDGSGIQVTGSQRGRARTVEELRQDLDKVYASVPGNHRLNLHAIYGEFSSKTDRNAITPEHFSGWIDWSRYTNTPLDFNPTFFAHPKAKDGWTLSSKDDGIRQFWVEHLLGCRKVAEAMGKAQGSASLHNIWIPDGSKDYPIDRMGHRKLLVKSLDAMQDQDVNFTYVKDTLETKLFGIGSEAYVVGSHEFYLAYALKNGYIPCFDLGHFHPTEEVSDKISSALLFFGEMLLHVSRPMRWDSDHVVLFSDTLCTLMEEVVKADGLGKVHLGLDFFDATLNRVGAWITGSRATLQALLRALLMPWNRLLAFEESGDLYGRMALMEEMKMMPLGLVWDYYCAMSDTPLDNELPRLISDYGQHVLAKRC